MTSQQIKRSFFEEFRLKWSGEKTENLLIREQQVEFVGGSSYLSLPLSSLEEISYQPRNDRWQEVTIKLKETAALNYYLKSEPAALSEAVKAIQKTLKPSQPICQFILSAKQGALSGKD
jgi:hypothetical protein